MYITKHCMGFANKMAADGSEGILRAESGNFKNFPLHLVFEKKELKPL